MTDVPGTPGYYAGFGQGDAGELAARSQAASNAATRLDVARAGTLGPVPTGTTRPDPAPRHINGATQEPEAPPPALTFETYGALRRWAATSEDPGWLARPVWPADAYGVIGAENKAGKTWAICDLMVAKAAGTRWLGAFDVDRPGRVLAFLGEGGRRKIHRRLAAVSAFHQVDEADIEDRLELCYRAPVVSKLDHGTVVVEKVKAFQPELIVVDPLYLSVRGANGSDLYAMGEHLELFQRIAELGPAALVVVTHWNKTGTGKGRDRFTGAGPAEWGRVTVSMSVEARKGDANSSAVTIRAEFVGDEIADREVTFVRTVAAEDPDDLRSPMTYGVEISEAAAKADDDAWDGPTQCMAAVEEYLAETGMEATKTGLPKQLRAVGRGFRDHTVEDALARLAGAGRLEVRVGPRNGRYYSAPPEAVAAAAEREKARREADRTLDALVGGDR